MANDIKERKDQCLYFTANALSRKINQLADEAFATSGLAPSYGFLLMMILCKPGQTQNELSQAMQIQPSTMTRFIEKLIRLGMITKEVEGRVSFIYPTEEAKEFEPRFEKSIASLYNQYKTLLGEGFAHQLTSDICKASSLISAGGIEINSNSNTENDNLK